jgi:hypothetical protein
LLCNDRLAPFELGSQLGFASHTLGRLLQESPAVMQSRRTRFSLRALFVITTIAAVLFAGMAAKISESRRQERLLEALIAQLRVDGLLLQELDTVRRGAILKVRASGLTLETAQQLADARRVRSVTVVPSTPPEIAKVLAAGFPESYYINKGAQTAQHRWNRF